MTPKFIPPFLGQEVMSNAEKKIFEILHSLEFSNGYVFHSVGLPFHEKKIYGETDFLLLCPRGILILEVKGGRVKCYNGRWSYMNRKGEVNRNESPFNQAKDNMFSVMDYLNKRLEKNEELYQKIPFGFGVMFPDIRYQSIGIEESKELVYDSFSNIRSYINDLFDYWESRPNVVANKLTDPQIDVVAKLIRCDFNYAPTISSLLEHSEQKIINLTNEQSVIIDALSENDRLVIKGGAGTGKTVLASYFAEKCSGEGKSVLYLTYNKNLANAVGKQNGGKIKTINVHAFFGEYVKIDEEKMRENSSDYFGKILPSDFSEYILSLSEIERSKIMFDVIVMDEAQDFLRPEILNSLDKILNGGFAGGKWAVFYDDAQNIYNPDFKNGFAILNSYSSTKFTLKINCRNTSAIASYCAQKSDIQIDCVLNGDGGEIREIKYDSDGELRQKTESIISELKDGEVMIDDVIFLSPHSYKNSVFAKAGIELNELGSNFNPDSKSPHYSSLQAFKGLDSKVAVIAGFEDVSEENFSQYFYIAATRARSMLYVLARKIN